MYPTRSEIVQLTIADADAVNDRSRLALQPNLSITDGVTTRRWIAVPADSAITSADTRLTYESVYGALDALERLEEQPYGPCLDQATSGLAKAVIGYLEQFDVTPPRLFSHGGDAVVMTWRRLDAQRYVTICDNCLSVVDFLGKDDRTDPKILELDNSVDFSGFLKDLGGSPWRKSSVASR